MAGVIVLQLSGIGKGKSEVGLLLKPLKEKKNTALNVRDLQYIFIEIVQRKRRCNKKQSEGIHGGSTDSRYFHTKNGISCFLV